MGHVQIASCDSHYLAERDDHSSQIQWDISGPKVSSIELGHGPAKHGFFGIRGYPITPTRFHSFPYHNILWYLWESNSRFVKSTVCFDDFPTEVFKFTGYFLMFWHRSHESGEALNLSVARLHQQDVMPIPAGLVEGRCWDRWWAVFWRTEHHQM